MSIFIFIKIIDWLEEENILKWVLYYELMLIFEDFVWVCGEDIVIGGKVLLLKCGDVFYFFVISVVKRLDSKVIWKYLGVKKVRFVSVEELMEWMGFIFGFVLLFGCFILDFKLYIDISIVENLRIVFNVGFIIDFVILEIGDYLVIV